MILAGDFRNGTTFEMDSNVFKIVEFQHVKPGKGAAFVRTKLKNVITGQTIEKTFNPTEKVEEAPKKVAKTTTKTATKTTKKTNSSKTTKQK